MTQNAINNAASSLVIDPGASGDSFVQFDINTTGEFRIGVDDGSGDAFKISQGSALGTNDTQVITAAGEVTLPLQPRFSAYTSGAILNVTGNNTLYTVVFNTERFDIGSNFSTTTGIFTAPIEGYYYFTAVVGASTLASVNSYNIRLTANGVTFLGDVLNASAVCSVSDQLTVTISALAFMTASSTAAVIIQGGGAGADVVDTVASQTFFQGFLTG